MVIGRRSGGIPVGTGSPGQRALTITFEIHSASSAFEGRISTSGGALCSIRCAPSPLEYTVPGFCSRADIHTRISTPFDQVLHTHLRNAQRFESVQGWISTPERAPCSIGRLTLTFGIPHASSRFRGRYSPLNKRSARSGTPSSPSKYTGFESLRMPDIHLQSDTPFNQASTLTVEIHRVRSRSRSRPSTSHSAPLTLRAEDASSRFRGSDTTSKQASHSIRCSTLTVGKHSFSRLPGSRPFTMKAAHPTVFDDTHR